MDIQAIIAQGATLDQLKTLYNAKLSQARVEATAVRELREAIERLDGHYRGPSRGHVTDAERSLYMARTFAQTPFDLPEERNPYRGAQFAP